MDGKYVSYLRVSTDKQGKSGLGLEAQKAAVDDYLNGGQWELLRSYTEIESGKVNARPELTAAMKLCKMTGATLLVAKLDRLSRDAAFLIGLQNAGVDFVAVDMPNANKFTVGIMALVAQHEREAISARTKAALSAAKARGVVLGGYKGGPVPEAAVGGVASAQQANAFAADVAPLARQMRDTGASLRTIAADLTKRGIRTPRGGKWEATTVRNLLARM